MFTLTISTTGAAFCDGDGEPDPTALAFEVARILKLAHDQVLGGTTAGTVRDANGNTCGTWALALAHDADACTACTLGYWCQTAADAARA